MNPSSQFQYCGQPLVFVFTPSEFVHMPTIAFPVKFGSVSFNAHVCRVPFKIDRARLKDEDALRLLVNTRIKGKIATADISQLDGSYQQKLFDDANVSVEGYFDTKGLGVTNKTFSSGATFTITDVEKAHAERLAGQTGIVWISESTDLSLELDEPTATVQTAEGAAKKKSRAKKKLGVTPAKKPRSPRKPAKRKR